MVSNHVPELQEIVDALGIGRVFHAVLSSGVIGYEKPHARMFEAALELTVPGAPVWMVGDSVEADCVPATSLAQTRFSFGQTRLSTDEHRIYGRRWT